MYSYGSGVRRGIIRLLRDYYRLKYRTEYKGDYDTAVILADLMESINSDALTPRQRQFIALYYFVGLTLDEVAVISETRQDNVRITLRRAIERISSEKGRFNTYTVVPYENTSAVYRWLNEIADGEPIGEPTREVILSIAEILRYSDERSAELIRQHGTGFVIVAEPDDGREEYPHYSDAQLRWLDRRVSVVSEVYPSGDVVGTKKWTPAPNYDESESDDYEPICQSGRKKLYKLWGN